MTLRPSAANWWASARPIAEVELAGARAVPTGIDHGTITAVSDGRPVEIIAAEIGGASLRTFERLFADETGLSLAAWRRHSRLLASLSLLAEGKSIGEVAHAVGYDSPAAFSAAFKQCFGVSPSNYG